MVNRLSALFTRAKEIFREEGLLALIIRTSNFAASAVVSAISFENSEFYVYTRTLSGNRDNEADYQPKISNATHMMIETVEQLEELSAKGYDLSLIDIEQSHYRLKKGAIASLVFVGSEFGHISWTALTDEAMKTINHYPCKVDFKNGEVTSGAVWTNPKYRRQGLNYYAVHEKELFLIERGITKTRSISFTDNIAVKTRNVKLGARIAAKARYIRIFGLQFWREK